MRTVLAACITMLVLAPAAGASELIDRNATDVKLEVNAQGQALVTYRAQGQLKRVLSWSAVNAIHPTPGERQVEFRLDYAGGYGTYRRDYWKDFRDVCRRYDGPRLGWLVTACKAPDGSYWALQSWQRALPNYGVRATDTQAVWELRLSHWIGELPVLDVKLDWSYRRFDHLYGSFTYKDRGVFGFRSTSGGQPLDTFGRNLYLDTFDSAYGSGWERENSFLTHRGTGVFCYGFYNHGPRPVGRGTRYRATIIGPGVTPDIVWESAARGAYDREQDLEANEEQRGLFKNDRLCKAN